MAKTETPKLSELDAATGELVVRDLTADEIAAFASATQVDFEAHLAAVAAARESRRAKLLALGLTEVELDA